MTRGINTKARWKIPVNKKYFKYLKRWRIARHGTKIIMR